MFGVRKLVMRITWEPSSTQHHSLAPILQVLLGFPLPFEVCVFLLLFFLMCETFLLSTFYSMQIFFFFCPFPYKGG